ncbi:hypothetical protein D7X33_10315 [Butyricicoccus sp. 1XD8-22]|nr:hypothetical protein D7X33_10315 [Butyricicoccus sp. 1XD8-22]
MALVERESSVASCASCSLFSRSGWFISSIQAPPNAPFPTNAVRSRSAAGNRPIAFAESKFIVLPKPPAMTKRCTSEASRPSSSISVSSPAQTADFASWI